MEYYTAILPYDVYAAMDERIRPLVRRINLFGITTISSCEGHLDGLQSGGQPRIPYPWISINFENTPPDALRKFIRILAEANHNSGQEEKKWIVLVPQGNQVEGGVIGVMLLRFGETNRDRKPETLVFLHEQVDRLVEWLDRAISERP